MINRQINQTKRQLRLRTVFITKNSFPNFLFFFLLSRDFFHIAHSWFFASERRGVLIFCEARVYRGEVFYLGSKLAIGHFLLYAVWKNELEKSCAPFKSLYQGKCPRNFDVEINMIHSNGFMKIDFVSLHDPHAVLGWKRKLHFSKKSGFSMSRLVVAIETKFQS